MKIITDEKSLLMNDTWWVSEKADETLICVEREATMTFIIMDCCHHNAVRIATVCEPLSRPEVTIVS